MGRQQTVTPPTYSLHEEGIFYHGTVKALEDWPDNGFGPQYKWLLVFDEDQKPGEDVRDVWHFTTTNYTTHEKNKLRIFYDGVMGLEQPVALGEIVDPDDCVGKRFKAIFKHGKKKDGSPKDDIIIVKPLADAQQAAA